MYKYIFFQPLLSVSFHFALFFSFSSLNPSSRVFLPVTSFLLSNYPFFHFVFEFNFRFAKWVNPPRNQPLKWASLSVFCDFVDVFLALYDGDDDVFGMNSVGWCCCCCCSCFSSPQKANEERFGLSFKIIFPSFYLGLGWGRRRGEGDYLIFNQICWFRTKTHEERLNLFSNWTFFLVNFKWDSLQMAYDLLGCSHIQLNSWLDNFLSGIFCFVFSNGWYLFIHR